MKFRLIIVATVLFFSGCSMLGGGAVGTLHQFRSLAGKGDVAGMTKLFSSRAIKDKGEDKIKESNKYFSDMAVKAVDNKQSSEFFDVKENSAGDTDTVNCRFGDEKGGSGSIPLKFALIKENGEWKIDDVTDGR
jgi:hypothetical protein